MTVIQKTEPNSFLGATLESDLRRAADLEFGETTVPGALVHAAFVSALASGYATVVSADELVGD